MSEDSDRSQLAVLSYLWYASGVLYLLGSCAGLVLTPLGWGVTSLLPVEDGAAVVGSTLGCFTVGLTGWGLANAYVGYSLAMRRHRSFVSVMSVVGLVVFPLGTLLGIFTLVVLGRPGMHTRYP